MGTCFSTIDRTLIFYLTITTNKPGFRFKIQTLWNVKKGYLWHIFVKK